jgi:hypothetical protein
MPAEDPIDYEAVRQFHSENPRLTDGIKPSAIDAILKAARGGRKAGD